MEFSNYKAHELKEIIAKKEASVEEVTKAHLDKIENTDSKVDAFLYVAKE
ncbi:Glutamyl-tRNA(Gln) amidotransferase subunit A, partial [human gut metagenome]